ncbi:receptor-like cytosolic serine/threonine-protein kinase RBK2 isoform X1 [Beta vulgaris subsp. vulgaris]|uniref:receptor-like cytosolic serine/threonine-protein kinase RBK2 isoform X1 n=1 Tax=Beta vulgaris subsp. vulgaris TaxID=3555 RepID=UPI0020371243|nr:receptor-like cytosolic serine/threonine-protein kinase RBK2 isoform X1 [Beta vulgaris subsp. vulgaris]
MEASKNAHSGLADKFARKIPAVKPIVRSRTFGSLFSLTAQDFRSLNIQKHVNDNNSSRGVAEVCGKHVNSQKESQAKAATICIPSKTHFRWRKLYKTWKKKSLKHLSSSSSVKKICSKVLRREDNVPTPHVDAGLCQMKASWKIFSFSDLQKATNNFSEENLIGKGGFAEVHKGCLKGGQLVAVKRLTIETHEERATSFLSELGIIAHVDHPNTAKLIGYGVERGLYIVLELSSLGSLGTLLNAGSKENLQWGIRYKIALGTADGLMYLHEECQRRIIHRDIKADNILLTENYEPQICDFGLAKWLPRQWTHHNITKFEGTFGYFAPEYFMHGIVDEKTDVYSFGVLLLELITGRRAFSNENQSILLWAKPFLDEHDLKQLVDPMLGDDYDEEELDRMVLTAALCTQQTSVLRPRMNQVVILLRGDDHDPKNANRTQIQNLRRTYSEELLDAKEYNSTKQLNDLRRIRQVAFASME